MSVLKLYRHFSNNRVYVLFLFITLFFSFFGTLAAFITHDVIWRPVGLIGYLSLILFLLLSGISFLQERFFFLILPFMIIAFPTVVNRFLPGVYYGHLVTGELITSPLITFFDVFMVMHLLHFLRTRSFRINFSHSTSKFTFITILILLLSFLVNLWYSNSADDAYILFSFLFHIKYLMWFIVLFALVDVSKYNRYFILGLALSVLFLFVEALFYTKMSGGDRLQSGSLQLNTFGNIIAAITFFFIFNWKRNTRHIWFKYVVAGAILVGVVTVIGTQNRSSIVLATLGAIALLLLNRFSWKWVVLLMLSVLAIGYFVPKKSLEKRLPERFQVSGKLKSLSWNDIEGLHIDYSKSASSIHTRFALWNTALRMGKENPFFGIGGGRFNLYKNEYGIHFTQLLNQHNGLLSIVSSYGLGALVFFFYIYLYPFYLYRKLPLAAKNSLTNLYVINFVLLFADITNSGIEKQGVYALLTFSAVYMVNCYNRYRLKEKI